MPLVSHFLVVLGTRPEAIKLAPVVHALRADPTAPRVSVCSTGQHRALLDGALRALDLPIDHNLDVMRPGQHPADLMGRLMLALRPLVEELRPDAIVVQGDTSTVSAAAMTGFLCDVRVAHVEAGLRTGDRRAPFPEEVNRRVTSLVADAHFAPTRAARENLLREGVAAQHVFLTGNTVVEALLAARRKTEGMRFALDDELGGRRLVLVTAHRRESFGEPFRELCLALRDLADSFEDVLLLYPVHLNPNVQAPVHEILGGVARVRLAPPMDYLEFVAALDRAHLVLTDSGGVQEEAPSLGRPTLVMREKTERPEGVAAGVARLVGSDRRRIVEEASRLLRDPAAYAAMCRPRRVYGDGLASRRICEVLLGGRMTTPEFEADA